MPRFVVLVQETQSKEIVVNAPSHDSAEKFALSEVGFDFWDPNDTDGENLLPERTATATIID